MNLVDPEGQHYYYLDHDGRVYLALKTNDKFDRLCLDDSKGKEPLTVYNQSILKELSTNWAEGFHYAISSSLEMLSVFDYVSSHSKVEWAIGSFYDDNHQKKIAIVSGTRDSVNPISAIEGIEEHAVISNIHTHTGFIQDHGASGYIAPVTRPNDRENVTNLYYRMKAIGKRMPKQYVYEVPNGSIYEYNPWRGDIPVKKDELIKTIKRLLKL